MSIGTLLTIAAVATLFIEATDPCLIVVVRYVKYLALDINRQLIVMIS